MTISSPPLTTTTTTTTTITTPTSPVQESSSSSSPAPQQKNTQSPKTGGQQPRIFKSLLSRTKLDSDLSLGNNKAPSKK